MRIEEVESFFGGKVFHKVSIAAGDREKNLFTAEYTEDTEERQNQKILCGFLRVLCVLRGASLLTFLK